MITMSEFSTALENLMQMAKNKSKDFYPDTTAMLSRFAGRSSKGAIPSA